LCTESVVASNYDHEITRLEGLALRECVAPRFTVG
jgi:hypothetical protein